MTLEATTTDGAAITVTAFDGNLTTVLCTRPYAPGQPMLFVLPFEPPATVDGRTVGARRRADGLYEIRLRLVALTREVRVRWLEAMMVSGRS